MDKNIDTNHSLFSCMKDIPDPRKPYNQKHQFLDVVIIAVLAVLCGMDTWYEIHDWALARQMWLETFLELPGGIPSHDTFNRIFQMMDPEKFHEAFLRWTQGLVPFLEGVVSIDGKTMRRSREEAGELRPVHVVSAWSSENGLALGQLRVDEKTNEIKAIPELLELLCLKGCIVTIDAMGTQKGIAKKIKEKEAEYILQVKGNQPELLEDISEYFQKEVFSRDKKESEKENRYYRSECFEHGRIEVREYYTEKDVEWLKERHPEWEGMEGTGACISTVTEKGKTTISVSYSIYSMREMTAKDYGESKRKHWGIENGLHWVLDIGFREDESRIRAGNAAENMNVLRQIGLNLLKQETSCKMGVASKRKKCGYDEKYLYKVLLAENDSNK